MAPPWVAAIACLLYHVTMVAANEVLMLTRSQLTVEEGESFLVPVKLTGNVDEEIQLVVRLVSGDPLDFVAAGTSRAHVFTAGTTVTTASLQFFTRDDQVPEQDEEFVLELVIVKAPRDAVLDRNNARITVTILANDDAYGIFGFSTPSPVIATEPVNSAEALTLTVSRLRGTFSDVTLAYTVTRKSGSEPVSADLAPVQGTFIIHENQMSYSLQLLLMTDEIPEPDESFIVDLSLQSDLPSMNNSRIEIIIKANDAPIRFVESLYTVGETDQSNTVKIPVTRGILSDGEVVGPLDGTAPVDYRIVARTATFGEDYLGDNGTLRFQPGETRKHISVFIQPDSLPETAESFRVELAGTEGDAVLKEPAVTEVRIRANDDQHGVLNLVNAETAVILNEDTMSTFTGIRVKRTGGTFGLVSVRWLMTSSEEGVFDVSPRTGLVTLESGVASSTIELALENDQSPEPARRFQMRLVPDSLTGGARLGQTYNLTFIVGDSDDMYGRFDFVQGQENFVTQGDKRIIEATIVRGGGLTGHVLVNYTATYHYNNTASPDAFESSIGGQVLFLQGQSEQQLQLSIAPSTFLHVGAKFLLNIHNTTLQTAVPIGPFNSPRPGRSATLEVPITNQIANGFIGLVDAQETASLEEPDQTQQVYRLGVGREGTNGEATVTWELTNRSAGLDESDVNPQSGTIVFNSGDGLAFIELVVQPDSIPEVDEAFDLLLTSSQPAVMQRLRPGAERRRVVISQNDRPGGVFGFSQDMDASYTMLEGGDPLFVRVVRQGGSLTEQSLIYSIEPNGINEFYGYTDILVFKPGEMEKNATILTIADQIPEIDEKFTLKLESYGNSNALIGLRSTVNITIPKNDDPNGVFRFDTVDNNVFIDESKASNVHTAEVTIFRTRGSFGSVSVDWALDQAGEQDLSPVAGTVQFLPGETRATVKITSVADELPESAESFNLTLTAPAGGAAIGQPDWATVVVNKNDDQISFQVPARFEVREGSDLSLLVTRDGSATEVSTVKYRTISAGANDTESDFVAVQDSLVFAAGETEHRISVEILQDALPEPDEEFYVELYDPQGDVVVYGHPRATVVILSNDNAGGTFRFAPPSEKDVNEGETQSFSIVREGGTSGEVEISYEILDSNPVNPVVNGSDFAAMTGSVVFEEQAKVQSLTLQPRRDYTPEFDEKFIVRLTGVRVVGGNISGDQAVMAAGSGLEVTLTVLENDDPHGVLGFPFLSRERVVAEDYYPGNDAQTSTNFTVKRSMGTHGRVQAVWGLFSDAGANLPRMRDLLFLGVVPPVVREEPSERRAGTGTMVLSFDGSSESFVLVPEEFHPSTEEIAAGFTVSVFLRPTPATEASIFAKATETGTIIYGLKLRTGNDLVVFTFDYLARGDTRSTSVSVTAFSATMEDGAWHSVMITVGELKLTVYMDGRSIGTRDLVGDIADQPGELYIGSEFEGIGIYTGLMQDLLFFSRELEVGEVAEIYSAPSRQDVRPLSGYLTFPDDVTQQTIAVTSLDDNEEETAEVFSLVLISAKGGARVSDTDNAGILKVLKSDNANGLFGFSGDCSPKLATLENDTFVCPVRRSRGNADDVSVYWAVYQGHVTDDVAATDDFLQQTGHVVFKAGARTGSIEVAVRDDSLPELRETFTVLLTDAVSADGDSGTTNTSGASIQESASSRTVSVEENDYPYGLFQFSDSAAPPAGGSVIQPATGPVQLSVQEESGQLRVLVVRAQGTVGQVAVEWLTVDGTATSASDTPDFKNGGGSLTFAPGQNFAFINITLYDDSTPEDDKFFSVRLLNPTDGAAINYDVIRVTILHSDFAYGVFTFGDDSLETRTTEPVGTESVTVVLEVIRSEGTLGSSTVTWALENAPQNDLLQQNGTLVFSDGQRRGELEIGVRAEEVPELTETFRVALVAVSKGELGELNQTVGSVIVEANDDPYGVFVMPPDMRPVRASEQNSVFNVTIAREAGSMGKVKVFYTILSPTQTFPFLPTRVDRASDNDYTPASGSVEFDAGTTMTSFPVEILADDEPEADESLFVVLNKVELIPERNSEIVANSPRLGAENVIYGHVVISANDNSSGVLVLSARDVSVSEGQGDAVLEVVREAGAFGEISVRLEIVPETAKDGLDYAVTSSSLRFLPGERRKPLPVDIADDSVPEREETFRVRLLDSPLGGAVIGDPREAVVRILPSDDPFGAFAFAEAGMSVEEDKQDRRRITIRVNRRSGTLNVVAVKWTATLAGVPAAEDVEPTEGTLFFPTGLQTANLNIDILPDNTPEGDEDIIITLIEADNGGRISDQNRFTLTVLANDNPHGLVQFSQSAYVLHERDTDETQSIKLERSGGTVGNLLVSFSVTSLPIIELATTVGHVPRDYFYDHVPRATMDGSVPGSSMMGEEMALPTLEEANEACLEQCLSSAACVGFQLALTQTTCYLYASLDVTAIPQGNTSHYFLKDREMATELYLQKALADADFGSFTETSLVFSDGAAEADLGILVVADDLPEVAEVLQVRLLAVELQDPLVNPENRPVLGDMTRALVTIAKNDEANGVLRIYSNAPNATDNGTSLVVLEQPQLAVELVVEREGGSLGTATVQWEVVEENSTAVSGTDYSASGATLVYRPGETRKFLTIAIMDDSEPENDEHLLVRLFNPTGGARLSSTGSQTNIVISANDHVGGVLSFRQSSVSAEEGRDLRLPVDRTLPALGNVTVGWIVQDTDGRNATDGFQDYHGTIDFPEGVLEAEVHLVVMMDTTPELDEVYHLKLFSPVTEGIRPSGGASLSPRGYLTTVTVGGSDHPHGVVSFAPLSRAVTTQEQGDLAVLVLTIIRSFGSIGKIAVHYDVIQGNVTSLTPDRQRAGADDFMMGGGSVDLEDGQSTGQIEIGILSDDLPEVDEVFVVKLVGTDLLDPQNTGFVPMLADEGDIAEVTIAANDATKGVIHFVQSQQSVNVSEDGVELELTVVRDNGTFGEVSVFFYTKDLDAKADVDYSVQSQDIVFLPGEQTKTITITITNDSHPEPDEQFEAILASPKNGVRLGEPTKCTVTILSNDMAQGRLQFARNETVFLKEPTSSSSERSRADLLVERGPGKFGDIAVSFRIVTGNGSSAITDLEPTSGVITMADQESSTTITIRALIDTLSEVQEDYVIELFEPQGGVVLGEKSRRRIVIESNDSPFGLLQIYPRDSQESFVTVEERTGPVPLTVARSRGTRDRVHVTLETTPLPPRGVEAVRGARVVLSQHQTVPSRAPTAWAGFLIGNVTYAVLLNRDRLGNLETPVGSSGSARQVALSDGGDTMLYRWQGVFVPVQTVETHGAVSATWFLHESRAHLLIVNAGAEGHYETNSRLYRLAAGGGVVVVQDLVTRNGRKAEVFVDAGKLYLILANYQNNQGRTVISSDLYQWDADADRFSSIPKRFLSTRGCRDVITFRIDGVTYVAVANHYDSETRDYDIDSLIYKFDGANAQFSIHQRLATTGASSLLFFTVGVDRYLALANSRGADGIPGGNVVIYRWDSPTLTFRVVQTIAVRGAEDMKVFRYVDRIYLTISTLEAASSLHHWDVNTGKFDPAWVGPSALTLTPILINQGQEGTLPLLGVANPETAHGEVLLMSQLDEGSDFVPLNLVLTFEPGQRNLSVSVNILEDDTPENIETFQARLVNPTHGSEVGEQSAVTVQIASNDDAFGIVQFSEESRAVIVEETAGETNKVHLSLERIRGAHSQIQILWDILAQDGGQILANDVSPISGHVTFVPGSRAAMLEFEVPDDKLPELDRVLLVRLTTVSEPGSVQPGKGAKIGEFNTSHVTVQASDSPHGVISWRPASLTVQEPARDDLVTLTIVREQGTQGNIRIMYMTSRDQSLPQRHQAVAGEDYISKQDTVFMDNGVNQTSVTITVKHDTFPEESESFIVNLTSVQLVTIPSVGGVGPSIKPRDHVARITVAENDFAGGIVMFNVAGTSNARVDTYEGAGVLRLPINRTVGSFGRAVITWGTIHREANAADYSPQDGIIKLREGQTFTTINITINDDAIPEGLETFEVHLLKVDQGTAVLGTENTKVTVGILKNDSPNGVFGFIQTQQFIREPGSFSSDVGDSVTFDVGRLHGDDGSVTVTWRLTDRARDDFMEPTSGSLLFLQGEKKKSLILRTRFDNILEGNEEFTLSLVSADNNGDISPTSGDARVIVLADTGANGLISVEPRSRSVVVGEPSASYDGEVKVNITRGIGRFGRVRVTWQIIPRDAQEFVDLQGEVTFLDGQDNQTIVVKTKDDTIPELRKSYTLDITSATGGALISSATGAKSSKIFVAASDYPHGLFQFNAPQEKITSEDVQKLSVTLRRDAGVNGRVKVRYTTVSGTAEAGDDFHPVSGTLTFNNGEQLKLVNVDILQDTLPEGPEDFFLNITEVILEDPSDNDYSIVDGVRLDMPPSIGPLSLKKIIIDKSDNAEGILEFDANAAVVTVEEEAGFAQIPVIRRGGSYGEVSATYTATDGSAGPRDYSLPNGTVVLGNGIQTGYINATIIDDAVREFGESFQVRLVSTSGGAVLGGRDTMTVTIRKSDFPNGEFRFVGPLELTIPNPAQDRVLNFTIERSGGNLGKQTLQWRLMGFNDRQRQLFETDDIYHDLQGTRRTDGLLEWQDGDNQPLSISFTIVQHVSLPEIEKTFWLLIDDVIGFPATDGSGEISATAGSVRLTILKYGHPNGIVRFVDSALQPQVVLEPEEGVPSTNVDLDIYRTDGVIGELKPDPFTNNGGVAIFAFVHTKKKKKNNKVHWIILGPQDSETDILPQSGQATIDNQQRSGTLRVAIQADDEPELMEEFLVVLTVVDGGAEIMQGMNTSKIIVRYNDDPHGVFAVFTEWQSIVVNPDMTRSARVNITRQMGKYGIVRVGFTMVYDQSSSVGSSSSSNSLTFEDGATSATLNIMLPTNLFMALNSTFTLSLSKAEYIGNEKLIEPRISMTDGSCQVVVGEPPANSLVGFSRDVYNVDEVTNEVLLRVTRLGVYGNLQVRWRGGYPSDQAPVGFTQGTILTSPYSVALKNQQKGANILVKIRPNDGSAAEQFAVHLPEPPVNTIPGGAQLRPGHTRALIDVHGVVGFHEGSRYVTVDENVGTLQLRLSRVYGSSGTIRLTYVTYSSATEDHSASADADYRSVSEAAVTMDARQTTAVINIRILGDSLPEVNEHFYVNITRVELVPTGQAAVSPRVSALYAVSRVTIRKNNHPHGLVYIAPDVTEVQEGASTRLTVYRVGGTAGFVSVTVRTLGLGNLFSSANGTVAPTADSNDFVPLETRVNFDDGSSQPRHVTLHTLRDSLIEPDESLVVYISDPSGGVAVLQGQTTDNYMNSSVVTIRRSGLYNGVIGFSTQAASINEDETARTSLRVVRTQTYYDVTISWEAKLSLTSDEQQDMVMADPERKSGSIVCPRGARECLIDVRVRKDELPERQSTFVIVLKNHTHDGSIVDPNAFYCVITVNSSDHPDGLIQFAERSRLVAVNSSALYVEIEVERLQGLESNVSLEYATVEPTETIVQVSGMAVAAANPNVDYQQRSGEINFPPNEKVLRTIKVWLTPAVEGERQYPRVFYIDLYDVSGGASIGAGRSRVLIVEEDQRDVWTVLAESAAAPLDNARMNSVVSKLLTETSVSRTLDEKQVRVVGSVLDIIIVEAEKRVLPENLRRDLITVFCQLSSSLRADAVVGKREMAERMEKFVFTVLRDTACPSGTDMIQVGECAHIRTQLAKWYPENVNAYKYQGLKQDYFHLPSDVLESGPGPVKQCHNVALLEYESSTWFREAGDQILNQKIFAFSVEGKVSGFVNNPVKFRIYTKDKRIAPRKAQCVYSTVRKGVWDGSSDICQVTNNLRLGLDNYVDCECRHLSYYAVRTNAYDPDVIGYPIWFFIASFICMAGMLLAVVSHHLCSIYSMFSANLLIHFCFSIAAFQLCYVVNAFLSPDYLLVQFSGEDNYKCLVMGLFMHYFFLTQFTWLFAQALNYWKILVLNDENTERKYALYLLIGWGLPVLLVAIFYVTVYCLYRYVFELPVDTIYGDVNYNGNICFVSNPFTALAGVIAPAVLCLLVLGVVFIQAYQVTAQWQAYDDVYRGRYNIKEVKLILLFFTLLVVAYIWGGLHMTFSHIWWLILYCIFIILMGLLAFVFYTCLRTPCLPCFKPHEESYSLSMHADGTPGGVDDPLSYHGSGPPSVVGSLRGSKASLLKEPSWDGQSLTFAPGTGLRRPSYLNDQIFSIYEPKPPLPADEERNDRDFDDLIFALKSEGMTPSEVSVVSRSEHDYSVDGSYDFSVAEANQTLRRISIADTHL